MCVVVSLLAALGPGPRAAHELWTMGFSSLALLATGWTLKRGFTPVSAVWVGAATLVFILFGPVADGELLVLLPVFMVYVELGLRGGRGVLAGLSLAVAYAVHQRLIDPSVDWESLVIDAAGRVATMYAGVVLVVHLHRAARENDRLAEAHRDAERVAGTQQARKRQAAWVDHYLHDGVVHALKAVALGDRLTQAETRAAAAAAATDLERLTSAPLGYPASLRDELRSLADDCGLHVRFTAQRVTVPAYVVTAIVGAAREALRNVRLHSGVAAATMELRREARGGAVLRIRDNGRGFDTSGEFAGHFGVRQGITERMIKAGGSALVESDGSGTMVTLTWATDLEPGWWHARLHTRHTIISVGTPFVMLSVLQCVLMAHRTARPWLAILGTAVVAGVWVACCVGLQRGEVGRHQAGLIRAAAIAASVCGGLAMPTQPHDPHLFWLAGGATSLLLFGAFNRPLRESIAGGVLLAVLPTVLALFRGAHPADLLALAPATATAGIAVGLIFIVASLARRLARDADGYERLVARRAQQAAELGLREELLMDRVADLREEILPFLAAIASGERACWDRAVVAEAAIFEARVRDGLGGELTAWPTCLATSVDDLRRAGWSVSLARHVPLDAAAIDRVRCALQAVIRCAGSSGRILVSSTPRPTGPRLTVGVSRFDAATAHAWSQLPGNLITDCQSFLLLEVSTSPACRHAAERPEFPGHARSLQIATMET